MPAEITQLGSLQVAEGFRLACQAEPRTDVVVLVSALSLVDALVPERLQLRLEPLLRFHRYHDLKVVTGPIREAAEAMRALAETLATPRAVVVRRRVTHLTDDALALEGGTTLHGHCFAEHVRGAGEVVCFVATVGPALEERARVYQEEGELLEALFLDTAGWLAVQETVRALRGRLAVAARAEGHALSPRLGPGYLDWPLEEQHALFSVFAGHPLPVQLTRDSVMIPQKSLSGLFGMVPGR